MRLKGKVAIITGATSGIGRASALLFAAEGASVVVTGRRSSEGLKVQNECTENGFVCHFIEANHTQLADCVRVVKETLELYGQIDILFNNAGIVTSGTAETTTDDSWERTIATNVTAVWWMCREVIPHMKKQGHGCIVNTGSDWDLVAHHFEFPHQTLGSGPLILDWSHTLILRLVPLIPLLGGPNAFPYIMSKGAVALMTKSMAIDLAPHIRVNAVCPGDTYVERWSERGYFEESTEAVSRAQADAEAHDFIPLGRVASADEIAKAALFLASDDSSFVTGHLLVVDGGSTAQ